MLHVQKQTLVFQMSVDKMWIKILAWWIVDKDDSHPVFQGPDSHIGDLSQR